MTTSEFPGPGLSRSQWEHIEALASSLDARQLNWVSGFMAGVEYAKAPGDARFTPLPQMLPDDAATAAAPRRVTVLYGSETGNGAAVAKDLAARLEAAGHRVALHDMASYKTRQLGEEQDLLIVTSTYGEGDPPQPAAGFFEFIEGRKAPRLEAARFAVLALGDSTYERYCEAGKRIDARLQALGAERLLPRVDCDVDYEDAAAAWIAEAVQALGAPGAAPAASAAASFAASAAAQAVRVAAAQPVYDKRNPYAARVIDNVVLTGRGSSKETRHLELSLEGSGLSYEPGDALGVVPRNDPALVDQMLALLGLPPSAPVDLKGGRVELGRALESELEITAVTPRFLEHWAQLSGSSVLAQLCHPDKSAERAALARSHGVIDVIRRFPVAGLEPGRFVAGLRPLQPRLYSISSSFAAVPAEVHLTVAAVRYELHGQRRQGVASGHLADRAAPDAHVEVYIHRAPHFKLPADDAPLIMVGAGTGVAPYRAFMQEREVREAGGRSWLFFGERNFRTDFLYQTEWQQWLEDGVLTRMDVAFSRDPSPDGRKTYVWHRLLEQGRDLYAWLEEGAHIYVCGDAAGLAPDVQQALTDVVMRHGGLDQDGAHDYLQRLQQDHRYQRDVY